jgi:hypothetical protein
MSTAGVNRPFGKKYAAAVNQWLEQNGFRGMAYGLRAKCCAKADNVAAIEMWRASLPANERQAQNHPEVCVRNWRRATMAAAPRRNEIVGHVAAAVETARRGGRPIYWSQDCLRRAHQAMLQSRSSDLLTLARIALQAAIRSEADLIALLDSAPTRLPAKSAAPVEVALA